MYENIDLRPICPDEFAEFYHTYIEAFGYRETRHDLVREEALFDPERSLAVLSGGRIAGTALHHSRALSMQHGWMPIAAIGTVTVAGEHRGRGYLNLMMQRMLTRLYEARAEPVAALWASSATLYGRYGFGVATRNAAMPSRLRSLEIYRSHGCHGEIALVLPKSALDPLQRVYETAQSGQIGWLARSPKRWHYLLSDTEIHKPRNAELTVAVHYLDREPDGFLTFRARRPRGTLDVEVGEFIATNPNAHAALWRYVLNVAKCGSLSRQIMAIDDPLQHLAADRRGYETRVGDGLWLRIIDVARAFSQRTYEFDVDLVIDVRDSLCPWNAGRWMLQCGSVESGCVRTRRSADVAVSAAALASIYLGGVSVAEVAAAGLIEEITSGSLMSLSRALKATRDPWCPEYF